MVHCAISMNAWFPISSWNLRHEWGLMVLLFGKEQIPAKEKRSYHKSYVMIDYLILRGGNFRAHLMDICSWIISIIHNLGLEKGKNIGVDCWSIKLGRTNWNDLHLDTTLWKKCKNCSFFFLFGRVRDVQTCAHVY